MEASAAGRGGSMSIPTQPSRKEWRAVSDHHSGRNVGDEVHQGREPLDVDFCSITIDGSLDDDLLQRRLHDVTRQREELQQIETEIRSQLIARSEIIEMRNSFDVQMKEHANAAADFQEQLQLRDQTIRDLERKLEDKDRELHAIKLDNEAAWAKEDLLREQNKELANYRRERDHSDAERSQHVKQIHELQEHFQEKEGQILDLQDQNRAIQETILYKDERLREAQAWITRVQEMDALQSTTLQAELRERTEQYNQLWVGCQRQFAEMERVHLLALQQLQLELAQARERSGTFTDESRMSQENAKEISQYAQNDGNQLEMKSGGGGTTGGSTVALPNGNPENAASFASAGNVSTQSDHASGVAIPPSSIVGMPSYLPPAQLAALHPFVMHQHVPQSHLAHYQSLQQWLNQQAGQDNRISAQNERSASPAEQNLARPDQGYNYDMSVNGQAVPPEYMSTHIGQVSDPGSVVQSSLGEAPAQIPGSVDRGYFAASQTEQELKQISSQFQTALGLTSLAQNNETEAKEQNVLAAMDGGIVDQVISTEANTSMHNLNLNKAAIHNATESAVSDASFVPSGQTISPTVERTVEIALLDERSLLACIVRTIPPGGRIRISSTLPNRLGKMLAPLYWHDYKKKYGKLDDFLGNHPELFVIEGDQIQLREGAQKMVAANAAAAKVAAAAAASPPYSSSLPSMAVTPMAQNRPRKQQSQQLNGVHYGVSEAGLTNVKTAAPGQPPVGSSNGRSNSSNFGAKQQGRATGSALRR